jgi:hypothetical protein
MPAHIPHTPGAEPQIQPLPAAYAPTPEQESGFLVEYGEYLTTARLPKAGEHVVIDLAYVSWLAITGDTRPVTEENSILITAPLRLGDTGVIWPDTIAVDARDPNLEPEDGWFLPKVHAALIAHANTTAPASVS